MTAWEQRAAVWEQRASSLHGKLGDANFYASLHEQEWNCVVNGPFGPHQAVFTITGKLRRESSARDVPDAGHNDLQRLIEAVLIATSNILEEQHRLTSEPAPEPAPEPSLAPEPAPAPEPALCSACDRACGHEL
jgi:hypothetical protein